MEELEQRAREALENAYSPYSKIKIAAAIRGGSGKIYTGVNVENASYGLTVCAERNSFFAAVGAGERSFTQMVIVTDSSLVKSPCGACRQVLMELAEDLEIYLYGPNGEKYFFLAKDLLPNGFKLGDNYGK